MSIRVDFSAEKVINKVNASLALFAHSAQLEMEDYAKKNAPWKDRTSLARDTLRGYSKVTREEIAIGISANMEYSKYLELAHEKKYAILVPTTSKYSETIFRGVSKIVN